MAIKSMNCHYWRKNLRDGLFRRDAFLKRIEAFVMEHVCLALAFSFAVFSVFAKVALGVRPAPLNQFMATIQ